MFIKKIKAKNKSFFYFNSVMFVILSYSVALLLHISDMSENVVYSQIVFNRAVLILENITCAFTFALGFSIILRLIEKGKIR